MDNAARIVSFAMSRKDHPYIFAAMELPCTPDNRRTMMARKPAYAAKMKAYCPVLSGKQAACAGCKWNGMRANDCSGLTKAAGKLAGASLPHGASSQWNGGYWAEKGPISQIPRGKACFVYKRSSTASPMGHVGIYLGNGYVIDARGHAYGVKYGKLESYAWTDYAVLKGIYEGVTDMPGQPQPILETLPTLRKGSKGEYVKAMQNLLLAAAQQLPRWGADGDFGAETEAALKAFQASAGLKADGVCGPLTWAALLETGPEDEPEDPAEPQRKAYTFLLTEEEAAAVKAKYPGAVVE